MRKPEQATLPVLIAAISLGGSMPMTFAPIASNIAVSLGNNLSGVATAMTAYGFGAALNGVVLSPSIDRFGAWAMLRASLFVFTAAMLLCSAATSVAMLLPGHFLAGLAASAVLSSSYVLATGIGEPAAASRNLGRALGGWSVSMIVIAPLAGVASDIVSWRAVYGMMALLAAAVAFYASGPREQAPRPGATHFPRNLTLLFSLPVALLIVIFFLHNVTFMAAYIFVAQVAKSSLHLNAAGASILALMFGVGFAAGSLSSSWSDRLGAPNMIIASLLSQIILYLAMPEAVLSRTIYLLIGFIWGFFNQVLLANTVHLLTDQCPKERGTVVGLNSAATYSGMASGAAISAILFQNYGFSAVSRFCAVGVGFASLLALWYRVRVGRRRDRAS